MSLWLDRKYIGLNSNSLRNFKWKSNNLVNFSCPICGDSSKNKLKARAYFYEKNGKYFLYCHNCGASNTFQNFLKQYSPTLYNEYLRELFLENGSNINDKQKLEELPEIKTPKFLSMDNIFKNIECVTSLKNNHSIRIYLKNRMIPDNFLYRFYYTKNFKAWANSVIPEKFKGTNDEPRLIIPFFDKHKNVYAFQGRSMNNNEPKYIMIVLDESYPKLYGIDRVNYNKEYYIVEGPIDSLFLPNCLAMGGSDFRIGPEVLPNFHDNAIVVYDNEPRNKEILSKIELSLNRDMKVVIWPNNIVEKDINEMIMNGITSDEILIMIKNNVYYGLEGKLKLREWRKVR